MSLVLLLVPGPAVLYVVARSVDEGYRAGLLSTLGLAVGNLVHVTGASLGVPAIVLSSITAFTVLKYGGAAYLIYLGIRACRAPRQHKQQIARSEPNLRRAFWDGVLVNILNPKSALFLLAFLPQYVLLGRGVGSALRSRPPLGGAAAIHLGKRVHRPRIGDAVFRRAEPVAGRQPNAWRRRVRPVPHPDNPTTLASGTPP